MQITNTTSKQTVVQIGIPELIQLLGLPLPVPADVTMTAIVTMAEVDHVARHCMATVPAVELTFTTQEP